MDICVKYALIKYSNVGLGKIKLVQTDRHDIAIIIAHPKSLGMVKMICQKIPYVDILFKKIL